MVEALPLKAVDPVELFEEWWMASRHKNRDQIGYTLKKCLAWDAFYAAWNTRAAHRIEATASTATVDGLADELEDEAKRRYTLCADNHPSAQTNPSPSWDELSDRDKGEWRRLTALRQPAIEATRPVTSEVEGLRALMQEVRILILEGSDPRNRNELLSCAVAKIDAAVPGTGMRP